jgi:hypothetical protein
MPGQYFTKDTINLSQGRLTDGDAETNSEYKTLDETQNINPLT